MTGQRPNEEELVFVCARDVLCFDVKLREMYDSLPLEESFI